MATSTINDHNVTYNSDKIITNQLEYLKKNVIPAMIKKKESFCFRKPVMEAWPELTDYPHKIKQPMDLNTIKVRLARKFYRSSKECISDINQVFLNSFIYNAPGDFLVDACISLGAFLNQKLKQMPFPEVVISSAKVMKNAQTRIGHPPPNISLSDSLTPMPARCTRLSEMPVSMRTTSLPSANILDNVLENNFRPSDVVHSTSPGTESSNGHTATPIPSTDVTSMCLTQTMSNVQGQMELRLNVTPLPYSSLPEVVSRHSKKSKRKSKKKMKKKKLPLSKSLKSCCRVLKKLMSKKYAEINSCFLEPVKDVPGYYDFIKFPMDLGTVKQRIESNFYQNKADFAADIRLIFTNCTRFNKVNSYYSNLAVKLQTVFEKRFKKVPEDDPEPEDVALVIPNNCVPEPNQAFTDIQSLGDLQSEVLNRLNNLASEFEQLKSNLPSEMVTEDSLTSPDYSSLSGSVPPDASVPGDFVSPELSSSSALPSVPKNVPAVALHQLTPLPVVSQPEMSIAMDIKHQPLKRKLPSTNKSSAPPAKVNRFNQGEKSRPGRKASAEAVHKIEAQSGYQKSLARSNSNSSGSAKVLEHAVLLNSQSTSSTPIKSPVTNNHQQLPSIPMSVSAIETKLNLPLPMTYEEKRQLNEGINALPEDKLGQIINILKQSEPSMRDSNPVDIEIDFDALHTSTLRKLESYVRIASVSKTPVPNIQSNDLLAVNSTKAQIQRMPSSPDSSSDSSSNSSESEEETVNGIKISDDNQNIDTPIPIPPSQSSEPTTNCAPRVVKTEILKAGPDAPHLKSLSHTTEKTNSNSCEKVETPIKANHLSPAPLEIAPERVSTISSNNNCTPVVSNRKPLKLQMDAPKIKRDSDSSDYESDSTPSPDKSKKPLWGSQLFSQSKGTPTSSSNNSSSLKRVESEAEKREKLAAARLIQNEAKRVSQLSQKEEASRLAREKADQEHRLRQAERVKQESRQREEDARRVEVEKREAMERRKLEARKRRDDITAVQETINVHELLCDFENRIDSSLFEKFKI